MAGKPPASFLGKAQKYFGNTLGEAAAFSAGIAVAPALRPELEVLVQDSWSLAPTRLPDAGLLASGVAQGQVNQATAEAWARRHGYSGNVFEAMVNIENAGPGVGQAFRLWRRNAIHDDGFARALKREALEAEWIAALAKTKQEPLDPAQLAAAIHRNIIPDPGYLVGQQPGPDRRVPAFPQIPIDANLEASWAGLDGDHLHALVGLQGLPMGPHEAAQAYFRGNITFDDYLAAIAQGNTRNEWAQAIVDQTRQIPTARDFMENALRGHHDFTWAADQAARHGMSRDDAFVIYQNQGRPLNLHQISQAIAWGAHYNPGQGDNPDPWMQSVLLGAVRPEYYEMQDSLKYIVPSAFALRGLQQAGALTPDEAFLWYKRLGWEPGLSRKVADAFGHQAGAAGKEATAADLLTLWDGGKLTTPEVRADLEALGYPAAEAQRKMDVVEARRVAGATNTAIGDLHTAYKKGDLSNASVIAALEALGLSTAGATDMTAAWGAFLTAAGIAPPA